MIINKLYYFLKENQNDIINYSFLKKEALELSNNMICDVYGSCVHFAEEYLERISNIDKELLKYIYVIEGYVYTTNGKFEHTWIELSNGDKIDPTFIQFIGIVKKITKKKKYSALEYLEGNIDSWFKQRRKEFPHYYFK